jgi:hypothetical protein
MEELWRGLQSGGRRNAASPRLKRLTGEDDKVAELRAEFCAELGGLGCCGARAQRRRSLGGAHCHPSLPRQAQ